MTYPEPSLCDQSPIIYLVDDDPIVRRALEFLLTTVGYNVVQCASAESFLDRYDPGRPGCLIVDIRLPGLSGLDLQAHMVQTAANLPVIMMSGDIGSAERRRVLEAGAIALMQKPFDNELLFCNIRKALAHIVQRTSE